MIRTNFAALGETQYRYIMSKLKNLPQNPYAKGIAIAQVINAYGIREDRFDTVFNEVCKRL